MTDQAIQQLLQREISSNATFPQPSPNTLYFVFLPSGTTVVQGGSTSCQQFCGYHDAISSRIFYAVMPFPDCPGGVPQLDALTSTGSHELCEAITDPIPGQGWYDDANGASPSEIAGFGAACCRGFSHITEGSSELSTTHNLKIS